MNVFDYIEKELDRIEVGYTSYDGTKITLTMDEVRELVQNLKKKYKPDGDVIYRQDAIDALRDEFKRTPTNAIRAMDTIKNLLSAQPAPSLWFRIGEVCVNESKGDITAEVAIEKIRVLLKAETIYCKDCKYRGSFNYCTYKTRAGWITRDNGHCSEAERREE